MNKKRPVGLTRTEVIRKIRNYFRRVPFGTFKDIFGVFVPKGSRRGRAVEELTKAKGNQEPYLQQYDGAIKRNGLTFYRIDRFTEDTTVEELEYHYCLRQCKKCQEWFSDFNKHLCEECRKGNIRESKKKYDTETRVQDLRILKEVRGGKHKANLW